MSRRLPADYPERVYAGVLGKIIGVYLGRPVEGWTYQRIQRELGGVRHYVHDRLGVALVVTDDDISGTFTFLRALPDHGGTARITPAEIGQTWLDYLIENRTVLWWGGMGMSTEHTAYLRLKRGVAAPRSGSAAFNGTVVSEQIGAQIFIDGWAMVAPGRPELAADLARRAASVSHDGEAVHAAALLAAMQAQAFVEPDLDRLLDRGLSVVPRDCAVARMIATIRGWHAAEPSWRAARERLEARYGYHHYGGNCHVMPNHGLIILSLLYGEGDFHRSMEIVNTSGWDTDCNSGNLGCLLGIRGGLAAFEGGPDWRGPVADRLYLPTADGGRCITDAVRETHQVVATGRALAGLPGAEREARFGFGFPGSVQGFAATAGRCVLANVGVDGGRALALQVAGGQAGAEVVATTATFIPPEYAADQGYGFVASPTLYPGQTVRAEVSLPAGGPAAVGCRIVVEHYGAGDRVVGMPSPWTAVAPGRTTSLAWTVPDTGGQPVVGVGIAVRPSDGSAAEVLLNRLDWDGTPSLVLRPPAEGGSMWARAWVDACDHVRAAGPDPFLLIQNEGTGLRLIGTREWTDYRVEAELTPGLSESFGLAARAQGLRPRPGRRAGPVPAHPERGHRAAADRHSRVDGLPGGGRADARAVRVVRTGRPGTGSAALLRGGGEPHRRGAAGPPPARRPDHAGRGRHRLAVRTDAGARAGGLRCHDHGVVRRRAGADGVRRRLRQRRGRAALHRGHPPRRLRDDLSRPASRLRRG